MAIDLVSARVMVNPEVRSGQPIIRGTRITVWDILWEYARESNFTIVSADSDFVHLSNRFGPPPKVIRLERMDYSTQIAADLIRRNAIAISEFAESSRAILVLRKR
jgi:predicted nuclease of predicted toxin-antitoxin system